MPRAVATFGSIAERGSVPRTLCAPARFASTSSPDFSNWKDHDSYQEAFQRLISDLKASDSKLPVTRPAHPK